MCINNKNTNSQDTVGALLAQFLKTSWAALITATFSWGVRPESHFMAKAPLSWGTCAVVTHGAAPVHAGTAVNWIVHAAQMSTGCQSAWQMVCLPPARRRHRRRCCCCSVFIMFIFFNLPSQLETHQDRFFHSTTHPRHRRHRLHLICSIKAAAVSKYT